MIRIPRHRDLARRTRPGTLALAALTFLAVGCSSGNEGSTADTTASSIESTSTTEPLSFGEVIADDYSKLEVSVVAGWDVCPAEETGQAGTLISSVDCDAGDGDGDGDDSEGVLQTFANAETRGDLFLDEVAQQVGYGNAEFYLPSPGQREIITNEAIEVNGIEGWRLTFRIKFDDISQLDGFVDVVVFDNDPTGAVFAVVTGDDQALQDEASAMLDSIRPL